MRILVVGLEVGVAQLVGMESVPLKGGRRVAKRSKVSRRRWWKRENAESRGCHTDCPGR